MKRIIIFFLATAFAIPLCSQRYVRDWSAYGYDQYYVAFYIWYGSYLGETDAWMDKSWTTYEERWERDGCVLLKKCEYYTADIPLKGIDASMFNRHEPPYDTEGLCLANTLVDMKTPVTDNVVIPSMPDVNLFFVDLDFIIKQKNHLNSLTLPNMIRGVYSSSGEKLYVDTLYVEGDYACMLNNKLHDENPYYYGHLNYGVDPIKAPNHNRIGYKDDVCGTGYVLDDKEPVLIAKTVMYEGAPLKNFTNKGSGVGFDSDNQRLNYLMASQWGDQLESVELTDGSLCGIAGNAFNGCKTLKNFKINFSNDVNNYIGNKAFYECSNLKVVDINPYTDTSGSINDDYSNYTSFGDSAFAYCTSLDTFRCDNSNRIGIGDYMFLGCKGLRYISSKGVETVGKRAFVGCAGLTKMNMGKAETIGEGAFDGCTNLKQIKVDSVKDVGAYAFANCTGLTQINMGKAETIGEGAFDGCENLSGHISIPNARVDAKAFRNCANIESIDMNAHNFGEIGSTASFKGCKKLEYINVNDTYSNDSYYAEKSAFQDCINLKGIGINSQGYGVPFKVKRAYTCAFKNCRSLEADIVTCSEPYELYRKYVSSDGEDPMVVFDSAFVGSGIKSVTLSYVNAANAFDDCANLESATFWGPDEGRNTFELPDFRNCPKLKKIVVNGGGWDLEAQVTLKDEQTVKVIDNLDGLYLLGKPHIYVGDYPNYNFANTILYVPKGMKNVYRENALAPTFKDIVELTDEQVGIIKVTMDGAAENGNGDAPVYDLSGQRVLKTVPGNVYVSKGRKFIAK